MLEIQYIRTSTLLIQWDGFTILTDPWFAMHMRGLPVFVKPCIKPSALPPLDLVLASHLHPDHYDPKALSKLSHRCRHIIGPPGVEIGKEKIPHDKMDVLTDGQFIEQPDFSVRAFSVEHSGYENAYRVERNGASLFFAGDAKYSEVFAKIGERHNSTVALLPVGGTQILGRRIVMNPDDAFAAAKDLRAKVVIPIHMGGQWMSVPPLSRHPGRAQHLVDLAQSQSAPFTVAALKPGERVSIDKDGNVYRPSKLSEATRA
jgi:L-ascorbate metabolism protein UlaG (beta-lactamase superfamily)